MSQSDKFALLGLCLLSGTAIAFFTWKKWFFHNPYTEKPVSRWSGIKKKKPEVFQLETAQHLLARGSFDLAEKAFKSLLETAPGSVEAHVGLAECLFHEVIKGLRTDQGKKAEALTQYQWILDYYIKAGQNREMVDLYKKLLGPYTAKEFGEKYRAFMDEHAKDHGGALVQDRVTFEEHRKKLREDFDVYEGRGDFSHAYNTIEEILKKDDLFDIDPALLSRGGEVCLRVNEIKTAEKIFEFVAKRGDLPQTVRALEVLSQYWLKTQRQIDLARLYRESDSRFVDCHLFPEWVELGKKLRES